MSFPRRLRQLLPSGKKQDSRPIIEFDCFSRDKLIVGADEFVAGMEKFDTLNRTTDPINDYRNSFYYQYTSSYDGLFDTEAYFPGPIRSRDIMELVAKKVDFDNNDVLSIGCHNGAELYWLLDNSNASLYGLEENQHFVDFCDHLKTSYGLSSRLEVQQGEVLDFLKNDNRKYDSIILHGVIYMVKDPLHLIQLMHDRLKPEGICSIETYLVKDKRPIMQYVGDGSGWGDTYRYSKSFFAMNLGNFGLKVEAIIPYRHRAVYIAKRVD